MKKVLAIVLAAAMVLSYSMTTFAEIRVDGTRHDSPYTFNGNAKYVVTSASGDDLTVTGNVEETSDNEHAVHSLNGSTVDVSGNVTESGDRHAVYVESSTVKVDGDVTESGTGDAINANKSTVEVGKSIKEIKESGNGNAITALDSTVKVDGSVTENGEGFAIDASGDSTVEIGGNVTESGDGYAVSARNGSTVKIDGNVTGGDNNHAIYALKDSTTVIVAGNVEINGVGNAIWCNTNATVRVRGNVGGDSTKEVILAQGSSTVIVEGDATGNIKSTGGSNVYIGKLVGGSVTTAGDGVVHYLIGTADGSEALSDLIVDSNILEKEGQDFATIDGVEIDGQSKKYLYTSTSDFSGEAKTITLKSNDNNKKLEITGLLPEGVDKNIDESGAVTLTLNGDFKGGLQNLMLTLKDIIYDIFVDNDGNGSASSNPTKGAKGTAVDLAATANSNYEFDYWEVVSGNVTIDNNKFNIGTEDVVIKAHFKEAPQPDPKPQTSSSSNTIFTGTTGNPVTNGKWTKNADGTWTYTSAYKFSNTWGYIANPNDAASVAWYYFDRNGNMLTGWQKLYWNGAYKWYYFSQTKDANEGKCQLGGITPDGYVLNPDGSWKEN